MWLGAAIRDLAPSAEAWGGSGRTEEVLAGGDRITDRRIGLFECVGSTPMIRYARSSRIDKKQVDAYQGEQPFAPWRNRVFFVLAHPAETAPELSISDARHFLRFVRLGDAADHIARTGRGTINSDLLEDLEGMPSSYGPHSVACRIETAVGIVASDEFVEPRATTDAGPDKGIRHERTFGAWLGRPTPLFVVVDAAPIPAAPVGWPGRPPRRR